MATTRATPAKKAAPRKPAAPRARGTATTPPKDSPTRSARQAEIDRLAAMVDDEDLQISDDDIDRLTGLVEEELVADPRSPFGPDGEIRPIEIGKDGHAGAELAHIFTLDGEKFYIRKLAPPPVMLRFMRECRPPNRGGIGRDAATENAMLSMLGKRALDALCDSPDTTDENFAHVFTVVAHILLESIKAWKARTAAAMDPSRSGRSR